MPFLTIYKHTQLETIPQASISIWEEQSEVKLFLVLIRSFGIVVSSNWFLTVDKTLPIHYYYFIIIEDPEDLINIIITVDNNNIVIIIAITATTTIVVVIIIYLHHINNTHNKTLPSPWLGYTRRKSVASCALPVLPLSRGATARGALLPAGRSESSDARLSSLSDSSEQLSQGGGEVWTPEALRDDAEVTVDAPRGRAAAAAPPFPRGAGSFCGAEEDEEEESDRFPSAG